MFRHTTERYSTTRAPRERVSLERRPTSGRVKLHLRLDFTWCPSLDQDSRLGPKPLSIQVKRIIREPMFE